jgi:peptidoglycan hydrolase-like amidase
MSLPLSHPAKWFLGFMPCTLSLFASASAAETPIAPASFIQPQAVKPFDIETRQVEDMRLAIALERQKQMIEQVYQQVSNSPVTPTIHDKPTAITDPAFSSTFSSTLSPSPLSTTADIRVAIAQGQSSLQVGASTHAMVTDASGNAVGQLSAMSGITAQLNEQTIQLGDASISNAVWIQPQNGGAVFVGDSTTEPRWYRGKVLLVAREDGILAVNTVDLEQYLYSVVGSEVPADWHPEFLKAQAIAARSYAIFHRMNPADPLFDMTATEHHQVYNGLGAESDTTQLAVDTTRGTAVAFQGTIVETFYAANAQVIQEHHQGLQSMSQTDGNRLANTGYSSIQILNTYYPGTYLSKVKFQ